MKTPMRGLLPLTIALVPIFLAQVACDRAQEPFAPGRGFLFITGAEKREEGEGGVA